MTLPEGVLAYYLLKCASLSEDQTNICKATCLTLTYKDMRMQIERVTSNTNTETTETLDFHPVQHQFYAYDSYNEDYDQYDVTEEEEEDPAHDTYFTRVPSKPSPFLRSGGNLTTRPRPNPPDEFGRPSQCTFCHSIYHWYDKCPHAPRTPIAYRSNTNSRRGVPTRFRGGYHGNRGTRGRPNPDRYL